MNRFIPFLIGLILGALIISAPEKFILKDKWVAEIQVRDFFGNPNKDPSNEPEVFCRSPKGTECSVLGVK